MPPLNLRPEKSRVPHSMYVFLYTFESTVSIYLVSPIQTRTEISPHDRGCYIIVLNLKVMRRISFTWGIGI